jgi:hypothetical protein
MSALTPHIKVLRAEAGKLEHLAAIELNETGKAVLSALAKSKTAAADVLEAEERELQAPFAGPQVKGH